MAGHIKIIELLGIPGAGKSYLLHKIKAEYKKEGNSFVYNDLITQFIAEKYKILFFLKLLPQKATNKISNMIYLKKKYDLKFQTIFKYNYQELFGFIKKYNNNRQLKPNHKKSIIRWFLKTGEYYILADKIKSSGVLIIPEGFAQRVSSLFISALEDNFNESDIVHYLKLIPKYNELLYISRNFNKCLKARIEQPGYRLKKLSKTDIEKILKANNDLLTYTYKYLSKNRGGARIILN